MFIDHYNSVVMEHVAYPGNIGDSCAETFRLEGLSPTDNFDPRVFITDSGYLRHPTAPSGWREDDFSGDQALPMYLYFTRHYPELAKQFEERVKAAGWKTGNGDFLAFIWITVFFRAKGKQSWLTDLPLLAQALTLRFLPYRWSDSKRTIERASDHTADWLNYFHVLLQAARDGQTVTSRLAARLTPHSLMLEKIRAYYQPEPNSFVVDLYQSSEAVRWLK